MAETSAREQDRRAFFVAESARDLLLQATRNVLLTMAGATLMGLLWLGMAQPELAAQVVPVGILLCVSAGLALRLLPQQSRVAHAIFLMGAWACIGLAARLFDQPAALVLLVVLPLVGASSGGGLLTAAACALAAVDIWGGAWLHIPSLPDVHQPMLFVACLASGLLAWVLARTLLDSVQRSLAGYAQIEAALESYQQQRVQFLQIQQDLVLANRELARLSDRLKTMTQLAEDARRIKEEFVANVSHELRTPLNMIIGFSEVILKSPKLYGVRLPDPLLADIRAIQRNSRHLAGLVNDVLALSQAESGKLVLAREWVNLAELLEETREAVKILFESKGLYLHLELSGQPIMVFCDRLRIREVVLNLLSNAGRFTSQGGVILRAWLEGTNVLISVADTGPGIAAKDQQRIFEPFQRLPSVGVGTIEGSGLGLSISRRFVEMHDGQIWLESAVGRGATFYLRLPLEPLTDAPATPRAARWVNPYQMYEARTRRSEAPPLVVPPRFIIMEESNQLQRLFQQFAEGVEIVAADSIATLIAESKRAPATAAVVNTLDPAAVTAEIRAAGGLPFDTPLLMCWIPGELDAARALGVVRYLVKPVAQEALTAAINEIAPDQKTVLVVDDNPEALQLFSRMLTSESASMRVLRAMNGPQALGLMRTRQPDVVLLDLVMPEMDGFQVLREKEKDPTIRQIPVLVVSSLDPMRGMAVSNLLSVSRRNGLTPRELTACIQAISSILTQGALSSDLISPETPPA